MKTKILILFLSLLTFAGYSQTDIKANNVKVAQTLTVAGTTNLNGVTNLAKLNLSDSTKLKNVTVTGEIDLKKTIPSLKMTSTGNNQTYNVLKLENQKLYLGNGTGLTIEGTGGANTMYIQGNNGNVGIGTDSPTAKLHVVGNTTITGTLTAGSIIGNVVNANLSGVNTGDETTATIQSKLGISTLSGSNTGDETAATIKTKLGAGTASLDGYLKGSDFVVFNSKQNALIGTGFVKVTGGVVSYDNDSYLPLTGGGLTGLISATNLTGTNTGDETAGGIRTKLGITTLSGTNTGDETNATIQAKLGTAGGSTSGYLTSSDWNGFALKQNALSNASGTGSGILTATDWTTFNGKQNTLSTANGTTNGILSSTDWTTFNNKLSSVTTANATTTGLLTGADWTTFNNKQSTLSGTGFVKSTGGVISYDNVTYLSTNGGTMLGLLNALDISTSSNVGVRTTASGIISLDVNGSRGFGITEVSIASYTLTNTDANVFLTTSIGQTITLPTATGNNRRIIKISNVSAVPKTISSYTTRFGYTDTVLQPNAWLEIQSNGTIWREVSSSDNQYEITITQATGSGTLGGVAFSVSFIDPMNLNTSTQMTGFTDSRVQAIALGGSVDAWSVAGSAGVGTQILRSRSWNATSSGTLGIYNAAYSCTATGFLSNGSRQYQIFASSTGGTIAMINIKLVR